jgi:Fe/S biogenesis protein NfuA
MTFQDPVHSGPFVTLSDEAREKVIGFKQSAPDPDAQAMWIEISGQSAGEYTYDLSLKPLAAAGLYDAIEHHDGLAVVIPARDFDNLRGATVEWSNDLMAGGLRVLNPNRPAVSASPAVGVRPPADLTGDVPQRVVQVLEQQINPSIAAHGGRADLVAVEDGTAYLRLSGGCQGCGMASVTLSQGIEVALRDGVPEVQRVVDVTDHAAGSNPYFEPSKK